MAGSLAQCVEEMENGRRRVIVLKGKRFGVESVERVSMR